MAYTKLASSIITSTIWSESHQTLRVWITMLALADRNGEVEGTIPGLAGIAKVTVAECEDALATFLSPDPYSRTKACEGRRIEIIEGGWSLINHAEYRNRASKEDSKAKNAARQARLRSRRAAESNAPVTQSNAEVTHGRDIAEADTDTDTEVPKPKRGRPPARVVEFQFDLADPPWLVEHMTEFLNYRKNKKGGLTQQAWKIALKIARQMDRDALARAVDSAILSGWTGLYPPSQKATNSPHLTASANPHDGWEDTFDWETANAEAEKHLAELQAEKTKAR
jgi:hypothetical protein